MAFAQLKTLALRMASAPWTRPTMDNLCPINGLCPVDGLCSSEWRNVEDARLTRPVDEAGSKAVAPRSAIISNNGFQN